MSRRIACALVIATLAGPARAAAAPPVVDGKVDAAYGAPVARDKAGDAQKKGPVDLLDLYATRDARDLYLAFTVNADIRKAGSNWGKYILYIDTTGDKAGATSDAWGRSVRVADPHKPELSINTWVDDPRKPYGPNKVETWGWQSGAGRWKRIGTVSAAALGWDGKRSTIEWRLPLSMFGVARTIWIEVWSTGGGSKDNAQDTINKPAEDWNARDWTTTATLKVSTPISLATVRPDAGVARPDAAVATPDAGVARPDAAVATPDAAVPAPDARVARRDVGSGAPDAGTAAPDAAVGGADSTTPRPDGSPPAPDGAPPAGDGGPGAGDAATSADARSSDPDLGPAGGGKQSEGCTAGDGAGAGGSPWAMAFLLLPWLRRGRRSRR